LLPTAIVEAFRRERNPDLGWRNHDIEKLARRDPEAGSKPDDGI
jgi:hypothetical protein